MLEKGYLQWMSNYNTVNHYKADSFQRMSPCLSRGHNPLLLVQQLWGFFVCVSSSTAVLEGGRDFLCCVTDKSEG